MRCETCHGTGWVDDGSSVFVNAKGGGRERRTKIRRCPGCKSSAQDVEETRPELDVLFDRARSYEMTPEELFEQRVSFVWGMLPFNSPLTKEQVRREIQEQAGVNDRIDAAATAIAQMYEHHLLGGALHIVTEDYNVEDRHMEMCRGRVADELEEACFQVLLPLTPQERLEAVKLFEQRENDEWMRRRNNPNAL